MICIYTKISTMIIFSISLLAILFEFICGKWILKWTRYLFSLFLISGMILKDFTIFLQIFITVLNYQVVDFVCWSKILNIRKSAALPCLLTQFFLFINHKSLGVSKFLKSFADQLGLNELNFEGRPQKTANYLTNY